MEDGANQPAPRESAAERMQGVSIQGFWVCSAVEPMIERETCLSYSEVVGGADERVGLRDAHNETDDCYRTISVRIHAFFDLRKLAALGLH